MSLPGANEQLRDVWWASAAAGDLAQVARAFGMEYACPGSSARQKHHHGDIGKF